MDATRPVFRVAVLKAAGRSGLLFSKQDTPGLPYDRQYFYLKGIGLPPTEEMYRTPDLACHELEAYEDQHLLFRELIAYADAAHAASNPRVPKPFSVYESAEQYSASLSHFFEPARAGVSSSPLRHFLGSRNVFTLSVLTKIRARDELVGRAASFQVASPEQFFPRSDFRYLQPITNVLRIGDPDATPTWFRRSGPVAADFDDLVPLQSELEKPAVSVTPIWM